MVENIIIHNKCGLPVELCECKNAEVVYDFKLDKFIDQKEDNGLSKSM